MSFEAFRASSNDWILVMSSSSLSTRCRLVRIFCRFTSATSWVSLSLSSFIFSISAVNSFTREFSSFEQFFSSCNKMHKNYYCFLSLKAIYTKWEEKLILCLKAACCDLHWSPFLSDGFAGLCTGSWKYLLLLGMYNSREVLLQGKVCLLTNYA